MTVEQQAWPLPIVDIAPFLENPDSPEAKAKCKEVAEAFLTYSALAVRDPRVSEQANNNFLDIVETYFDQPTDVKLQDARPEVGYQVGVTPENTEVPRCGRDASCLDIVDHMDDDNKPHSFDQADPKWRYFWNIGERPKVTKFSRVNPPPVIPAAFPQWENVMNEWGNLLYSAVSTVSEMAADGLDLPRNAFSSLMKNGPHLLAPTATDLDKYGKVGTVLAGFHYDLNFLTIHGKSRYPGLYVWPRNGKKLLVKIPDGCLLVQAGAQMEYLTGGQVMAGYHEVVVVPQTLAAMERNAALNRPLWRISSTLFSHIASDNMLKPLGHFATKSSEVIKKYPETYAGDQVRKELEMIKLMEEEEEVAAN